LISHESLYHKLIFSQVILTRRLNGFTVGLLPGFIYSFDSKRPGFSFSVNSGYQWIIGKGLVVGTLIGGRYIYIDGTLIIPDLSCNIGWNFN